MYISLVYSYVRKFVNKTMQIIYRNKIAKHNKTKPMKILEIELFMRSLASKLDELISCSRLFIN